ncbi:MAG: hypothetical protein M3Z14_00310 [Candidatus Eremiobacteraeota bacterium]|nr:hypothetical protein [Candidatus Eremiobacteraeota bacterium]
MDRNIGDDSKDILRDKADRIRRNLGDPSVPDENESDREGIEDLGAGLTGGSGQRSPGLGAGGGVGSNIRSGNERPDVSGMGTGASSMGTGASGIGTTSTGRGSGAGSEGGDLDDLDAKDE